MKFFIKILFFIILFTAFLYPSVFKGQKEYMKKCKTCHGNGAKIAKSKTTDEWIRYFQNSAKLLKDAHKKDEKAMDYLNSERFDKKAKHLLDFFKKYSADSGNVPACSD